MQFPVLLLLLLQLARVVDCTYCTNDFTPVGSRCLKFFSTPSSYSSAESTCASFGGTVVTVKNSIDNRAISSFIGTAVSQVWLGIFCIGNDASDCYWSDDSGSAANYSSFAKSFPYIDVGNCVHYVVTGSLAGKWVSATCADEQNPFVCELPTTAYDTNSCTYNYNGYCYIPSYTVSRYMLPASQYQSVCESNGLELVSISSANEFRFIKTIPLSPIPTGVTIGGQQYVTNSSHIWTATTIADNFLCKRVAGASLPPTQAPVTPSINTNNQKSCNSTVMAPGSIISTGFPGLYDNDLNCYYLLAATGINRVSLAFSHFDTEYEYDIVRVYDGDSANSPMIAELSGRFINTPVIQSTGNTLYVVFTSDDVQTFTGFQGSVSPIIG